MRRWEGWEAIGGDGRDVKMGSEGMMPDTEMRGGGKGRKSSWGDTD